NRMNDLVDGVRIVGNVRIGGSDIYDRSVDVTELRKRVGMVFQKSNPFPKSIFENVAYGPRILGLKRRSDLEGGGVRRLPGAAGTGGRTASWGARWVGRAGSSSACASPGPSPWSPMCS